jgi:hypothetical protein
MSQEGQYVSDNFLQTLTGDTGGPVPPDGSGTIFVLGGTGTRVVGTPGSNTITIDTTGSGVDWNLVTVSPQTIDIHQGYVTNNAAGITYVLPATMQFGEYFRITGINGLWTLTQNAGQTIHFGNQSTTTGVGGSIASTHVRDAIDIVCVVADTDFQVLSSIGNFTVT